MNFMSGRSGFYEEITGSRGVSSSASSSSTAASFHHHHGLHPYPYPPSDSSPPNNDDAREDSSDDHFRRGGEGGGSSSAVVIQREHMFDKVVTPSDVGKLNRLVIPKQHAEKYFPLDSSTNEKGLLLSFEDRNGKPWRFRYSYWNSSQSYVMTKGWSRFVKEKKLDAGDIVSFQRGIGDLGKDRLFIDWRRRPHGPEMPPPLSLPHHFSFQRSIHPWSPLFIQQQPSREYPHLLHPNAHHLPTGYGPYPYNSVVNGNPCPPGSIVYLRSAAGGPSAGGGGGMNQPQTPRGVEQMVFDSVPVVQGKAAAKRLRLFGVNMDCPISESDECDILSSTTLSLPSTMSVHHHQHHQHHHHGPPPDSSLQLGPNYNPEEDKGKGSMSLDLDI